MTSPTSNIEHRTSNPSILILGAKGMLGHKMFQVLSARYPRTRCTISGSLGDPFYRAIPLFRPEATIEYVNAMDFQALKLLLEKEKSDYIINCIGIVKQRDESKMAIPSITLNSLLPHLLAEWTIGWGGRLIHFSSDCVFSGKKGNYSEDDPIDAEDLYGKSKYLGDVTTQNALTLRTSIIGRELSHFKSLLEWFLAQKGKKVMGYRRVIYSGLTTNYLAALVGDIIQDHSGLSGLYNVTSPRITKYDLLVRIRDAYKLNIEIIPNDNEICDRSLNGERFRKMTGYGELDWDDLITQLTGDKTPYDQWLEGTKRV